MEQFIESIINFYNSPEFNLWLNISFGFLLSLHLAISIWVAKDVALRSNSAIFQIFAVAVAIFLPLIGLILYLLLRPTQQLAEKIIDNFVLFAGLNCCPFCGGYVKGDYHFCPHCAKKLDQKCAQKNCHQLYPAIFEICPFCGEKNDSSTED